jgi:16S rRNA (adenine(1408)-N(1))-methyltransferase
VVASAEAVPPDLAGRVDELTIQFPWASLLRGTLALDDAVARGIATLLTPNGEVHALLAPAPKDNLGPSLPTATALLDGAAPALAQRWAGHGLTVTRPRAARVDEIRASGSSWAKRLRAGARPGTGHDRAVVQFTLRRA